MQKGTIGCCFKVTFMCMKVLMLCISVPYNTQHGKKKHGMLTLTFKESGALAIAKI